MKIPVIIVNEESINFLKIAYYKGMNNLDAHQEKILRSAIKSIVEKNISQKSLVICDSLNYIKGKLNRI